MANIGTTSFQCRLLKQTPRITRFLGRSQNAIRIQIAVALVAYLLLRLLQAMTQGKIGWLELLPHNSPGSGLTLDEPQV